MHQLKSYQGLIQDVLTMPMCCHVRPNRRVAAQMRYTMSLSILIRLLFAVQIAHGSHFRGGSMSWKPLDNNQIELTYRVGFKYDHTEAGFDRCTPEAQVERTELKTSGEVTCETCSGDDTSKPLSWICDEYDVIEDSARGHNTAIYDVPEGLQEFDISYQHCCWVTLLSPINREGSSKGWKMITHVDVRPRIDGGRINASPVSALIPVEKFYKGCEYKLRIPVSDPDDDAIRCRYADTAKNECPDKPHTKACGPPTDGLVINKKDCTLYFDTREVDEGYHAVNVIIEDFIKPVKRKSKPLSKVPLLFLLLVDRESATCPKPTLVDPPSCKTVRPGEIFQMVIKADPGNPNFPIYKIRTQNPYGITESSLENDPEVAGRKRLTLQWYPTIDDIGEYPICYSALDSESYTSGISCTFVYVDDDPLRVDAEGSRPSSAGEIEAGEPWSVKFNKPIKRPQSPAFIKIIEQVSGNVVYEIASTDRNVVFRGDTLMFIPTREELFNGTTVDALQYELQLDEGVAIPSKSGCGSPAESWRLRINDVVQEVPSTPAPPTLECGSSTLEIILPNKEAPVDDDCLLLLRFDTVVYDDNLFAPYKLCCNGVCE